MKKGAPVRTYNLIKQAVMHGAIVDLITLVEMGEDVSTLAKELGVRRIIAVPRKKSSFLKHFYGVLIRKVPPYFTDFRESGISRVIESYLSESKPDLIQLELLHSFYAVVPAISAIRAAGVRIILNAHNVEYRAFMESVSTFSGIKYLLGRYIAPRLLLVEQTAAREMDHIFTCSEVDKSFFTKITSVDKVTTIPNGVDCSLFTAEPFVPEHTLIFAGGMYYPPNDDALRFYFHDVHPIVKKEIPDVKITLLGGEPNSWLKNMAKTDKSIITPGLVPDVRTYIHKARVCISPMRKGSGTSLKLLEYMGSGKPIVSTSVGARGIECTSGYDILLADDASRFANSIILLLKNDAEAAQLGEHARETAKNKYEWKDIGKKMIESYRVVKAL